MWCRTSSRSFFTPYIRSTSHSFRDLLDISSSTAVQQSGWQWLGFYSYCPAQTLEEVQYLRQLHTKGPFALNSNVRKKPPMHTAAGCEETISASWEGAGCG
jgi:hypothetical protein